MDMRYWIPVRHCVPIKGTIITTGTPVSRGFLGYHVQRRGPGTGGRADDPKLEHVLKLSLGCFETVWGKSSGSSRDRRTSGLDVVSDVVLEGCVQSSDLSEGRKLRQQSEVGIGSVFRAERRAWRTARGGDPVYLKVCASVNEFALVHVYHQSIVSEEISTKDGLPDISDDEYPWQ